MGDLCIYVVCMYFVEAQEQVSEHVSQREHTPAMKAVIKRRPRVDSGCRRPLTQEQVIEALVSADLLPEGRHYFPLDTILSLETPYPRAIKRFHEFHELKAYTPWVPRTITWIDGLEYFYVPYVDLRRALAQAMLPPIEAEDVSGL